MRFLCAQGLFSPLSFFFLQVTSMNPRGSISNPRLLLFFPNSSLFLSSIFCPLVRFHGRTQYFRRARPLPSNTYYLHFMAILQAKPARSLRREDVHSLVRRLARYRNAMRYITISCALSRSRIANRSRSVRAHLRRDPTVATRDFYSFYGAFVSSRLAILPNGAIKSNIE